MATGPEHYREAERLLTIAHNELTDRSKDSDAKVLDAVVPAIQTTVAIANVHATLALAAATAERWKDYTDIAAWKEATS